MKEINRAKLPSFWSGMSYVAKAAFLCAQGQARDFNEACSLLAQAKLRPVRPAETQEFWWNK